MAIWYILWQFSIFFPRFGILGQEKSGNLAMVDKSVAQLVPN
jgi:hypothetical protein